MTNIFLGIGSNIGQREIHISNALRELSNSDFSIDRKSSLYETEPWSYSNQGPFLNQVICGSSQHSPKQLISILKNIELKLGRTKIIHHGPRTIDIDILFYDQMILDSKTLTLPHSEIQKRNFVLVPLNEIAPDFIHPLLKMSINELLLKCEDKCSVLKITAYEKISE